MCGPDAGGEGVACNTSIRAAPGQNGKNERFNGIFRDECANMETFHHRDHARAICRLFQRHYHQERPHSSLDYQTPAEFARRHPPRRCRLLCVKFERPLAAPAGGGCRIGHNSP